MTPAVSANGTHWIGTSWKMNKLSAEAIAYANAIRQHLCPTSIQRFIIPPFTAIREVASALKGTDVIVGAQNMHWQDYGAWTGEISAPMLRDCGATIVELGHSERRTYFGETDEAVSKKVAAASRHGLLPLVCIGETADQKRDGITDSVLLHQIEAALAGLEDGPEPIPLLLAYEPVWAIGAGGSPADPDYVHLKMAQITHMAREVAGRPVPCLYGGNVSPSNCAALIASPYVRGLFIGRFALDVENYIEIIERCGAAIANKESLS